MTGGTVELGAFFIELSVGTGAGLVNFKAIVDTGSSNTAVPSVECGNSCGRSSGHYNFSASPTATPVSCHSVACQNCQPTPLGVGEVPDRSGEEEFCPYGQGSCVGPEGQCGFSISYGGSSSAIAGFLSQDLVCLGGSDGLCSPKAFVGSVTEEFPSGTIPQGIVGLAYPANACNPTCQPTLLDSLVASGALPREQNKFAMCLTRERGGLLDVGFFNDSRATGPLMWTPVVVERWYNIEIKAMLVGGHNAGVPQFLFSVRNDAIGSFVDSGTSILLLSPLAFSALQTTVTENPQWANLEGVSQLFGSPSKCVRFSNASVIADYPRIEFVVAGIHPNPDFLVGVDAHSYLINVAGEHCLAIAGVPSVSLILGDVVMQNYYIAFDRIGRKLGFAPIANCQL